MTGRRWAILLGAVLFAACGSGRAARRGDGQFRHGLEGRGRAWRLLPGDRHRDLPALRARRDVAARAGRRSTTRSCSPPAGSTSTSRRTRSCRSITCSENIPMVAVAAIFQKDPSVLIAHPGQGNDSLAALKGKPIMIGSDTRVGSWHIPEAEIRLHRRPDPALCVQRGAVPRRPQGDPAGLSDERAVHDRSSRGSSRWSAARRCRLFELRRADRDLAKAGRTTSPISCSALSMPASRAGTAISMAIRRRRTR